MTTPCTARHRPETSILWPAGHRSSVLRCYRHLSETSCCCCQVSALAPPSQTCPAQIDPSRNELSRPARTSTRHQTVLTRHHVRLATKSLLLQHRQKMLSPGWHSTLVHRVPTCLAQNLGGKPHTGGVEKGKGGGGRMTCFLPCASGYAGSAAREASR